MTLNLTLTDPHDAVAFLIHYVCHSFDVSFFRSVARFESLPVVAMSQQQESQRTTEDS